MATWLPIPGWFGKYLVSNSGKVKLYDGREVPQSRAGAGYCRVCLRLNKTVKWQYVHRLVLQTFRQEHPGRNECNHKDGNKENNRLPNLQWVTPSENVQHAIHVLGIKHQGLKGEDHPLSRLTERNVLEIRQRLGRGETPRDIAPDYKVTPQMIYRIKRRVAWSHI